MMRVGLSDEAVEREIAELQASPLVKLARKENRLRNARRQRLYALRSLQKRGQQLQAAGVTFEELDRQARMLRADFVPDDIV